MNDFDDLNDLDDVLGPLRSAARPAELVGESATVDLMVNAHRTSEGKHMFTSRRARIATLVAAGVLGFGGMAAASPKVLEFGGTDAPPVVVPPVEVPPVVVPPVVVPPVVKPVVEKESIEEEPVVEELAVGVLAQEAPLEDEDPDRNTDFDERYCIEDGNHGKTVSAVARGDSEFDFGGYETETGEQVTVKMAAQSSCGKTDDDKVEDETEQRIETEESDTDDDDESDESKEPKEKAERPGRSDKGADRPGNGNGKRGG